MITASPDIAPKTSVGEVLCRILATGRITAPDKNLLSKAMTAECPLSDDELNLVRCVSDRLQMGLLKVVA